LIGINEKRQGQRHHDDHCQDDPNDP
jgi:hypothetical protein